MTLQVIWFVLVGVLLAGYAMLDGFDLGVGTLFPFLAKSDEDKRMMRTSIGPVWDGNEVWLLTGGGALFAAFPPVYATVFSGFYLALMLVLFALIFRAVSFEFRLHDPAWAKLWDGAFFVGSALPALLFGVAAGNIVRGIPLDAAGEFTGTFFTLLNPFALVMGVLGLTMFLVQGSSWLALKTTGGLYERAVAVRGLLQKVFAGVVVLATIATFVLVPRASSAVLGGVAGIAFLSLFLLSIAWSFMASAKQQDRFAWYAASLSAVSLVGLWAASIFPRMVPALGDDALSLTISNSSSSQLALTAMLIIAAIGVPLVLAYTTLVYKTFAGKVQTDGEGY